MRILDIIAGFLASLFGKQSAASAETPSSFKVRFFDAWARAAAGNPTVRAFPKEMAYAVASLETDSGRSSALAATNSLFNRHAGSGAGFWTGRIYTTSKGEPLRVYASWEQSITDFAASLMLDGLYKEARAYAYAGQAPQFFAALARGNGVLGYVGPSDSRKAQDYVAALNSEYRYS